MEQKTATCKMCGQGSLLTDELKTEYPGVSETDELATLACTCEQGKKWREAKRQERINAGFISYAEHELVDFMKDRDYKVVMVKDNYGNMASLLKLEKGDIKITTQLKKII